MIDLHNIHKTYGSTRALVGISFKITEPSPVALLGPNGAGKTTLMRVIAGVAAPDAGKVVISGAASPSVNASMRNGVGFLPENAGIYPEMTPVGYLHYRARLYALPRATRTNRADELMERVGITDARRRRIGVLSKGYRQRVALAATLMHDPRILILDEPTAGLDPRQLRSFRALLTELAQERVVLISTHVLADVEAVADRVLVMSRGRLIHDGPRQSDRGPVESVAIECRALRTEDGTDHARLSGMLLGIPGVTRIEPLPRARATHRLRVIFEPGGADPRPRIARAISESGRELLELTPERATLEQRFHRLMDEPAGARETSA
jgi:ABC-2 type transport system ATP-binding protein